MARPLSKHTEKVWRTPLDREKLGAPFTVVSSVSYTDFSRVTGRMDEELERLQLENARLLEKAKMAEEGESRAKSERDSLREERDRYRTACIRFQGFTRPDIAGMSVFEMASLTQGEVNRLLADPLLHA